VVLAAIGLWYDDYTVGDTNVVTQDLLDVLSYSTGVEANDAPFSKRFPYLAAPWSGDGECSGVIVDNVPKALAKMTSLGLVAPTAIGSMEVKAYPNPFMDEAVININIENESEIKVEIYNAQGTKVATLRGLQPAGVSEMRWSAAGATPGWYFARVNTGNQETQTLKILKH
jgi:hypothetical protein